VLKRTVPANASQDPSVPVEKSSKKNESYYSHFKINYYI